MLDRFENSNLLVDDGGKAKDAFQMVTKNITLADGSSQTVVVKEDLYSDGFLVYEVDEDIDFIDLRGYRRAGSGLMPIIRVSTDGEEWTVIENGNLLFNRIFDGPEEFSLSVSDLPEGTRLVRLEIPELEYSMDDMLFYGVQIFYGAKNGGNGEDDIPNTNTGVALPLAAGVLAGLSGAALLMSRKRRSDAK